MSGILSQEEIDALLNNKESMGNSVLTKNEIDTLGEVGNISMGSAATALYEILGRRVEITTPKVSITDINKLASEYPKPFVAIEVKYTKGLEGYSVLVLKVEDAILISNLLMTGEGSSEGTLDDMMISAIGEIMNQMVGSSSTSLSTLIKKSVNIDPPKVFETEFSSYELSSMRESELLKISFRMVIEGLLESEIMQIMPVAFGRKLVNSLMKDIKEDSETPKNNNEITNQEIKTDVPKPENELPDNSRISGSVRKKDESINEGYQGNKKVNVKPLAYHEFGDESDERGTHPDNLSILLDVPLPITIELGKSKKLIKEILELNEGSIVVLDKFAGDLVDVLVNGKPIAKGEVVIVDENYGVRITDIISPENRVGKG